MGNETNVKLAEDQYQNKMQFAHVNTAKYLAHTAGTPVVYDADFSQSVVVVGDESGFIEVRKASTIAVVDQGFPYIGGTYYHTLIRKGEFFDSTVDVHICSLGEAAS